MRVERLSGSVALLASNMSQSNLNLTNSLAAMSADVRDMTKELKGMAPHAADIARISRFLEKLDEENTVRDTEVAKQGKQIEFWRGGIAVVAVVGGIIISGGIAWTNQQIATVNESRRESKQEILTELGKQSRRIERLEGIK